MTQQWRPTNKLSDDVKKEKEHDDSASKAFVFWTGQIPLPKFLSYRYVPKSQAPTGAVKSSGWLAGMTKRRKLRHVNPGTTVQSTTVLATGGVAEIMTGRGTITPGCITGCITGDAGRFAAIVGQLRPTTGHHHRRAGLQLLTAGDAAGASAHEGNVHG
jgi:hypothetical protein